MVLPNRVTKEENDFDIVASLLSDRVRLLKYVYMWDTVYWRCILRIVGNIFVWASFYRTVPRQTTISTFSKFEVLKICILFFAELGRCCKIFLVNVSRYPPIFSYGLFQTILHIKKRRRIEFKFTWNFRILKFCLAQRIFNTQYGWGEYGFCIRRIIFVYGYADVKTIPISRLSRKDNYVSSKHMCVQYNIKTHCMYTIHVALKKGNLLYIDLWYTYILAVASYSILLFIQFQWINP